MGNAFILGNSPTSPVRLEYGKQYIDQDDINAVIRVLQSPFLTCGPEVEALEKKLCELTGAKYAVVIANGTAALHAACIAAEIGPGDEVITTPITFAASANCVLYCSGTPVFADIDADNWSISPASIEARITKNTKAVIAVDYTGQAARLDTIREICRRNHLIFIEDAAHSLGTVYDGVPVGAYADLTTFSFHPVKTVTGGEGGAILTNNEAYYKKMLLFRSHGITRDPALWQHTSNEVLYQEQVLLGYNYRITDFQSALISSQLNKLPRFARRRKEIVSRYDKAFSQLAQVKIQKKLPLSDSVRHLYVLRFCLSELTATRAEIRKALLAENISCNLHYIPVYYHPYYTHLGYEKGICPVAEALYEEILTLPLHVCLSDEDVQNVIDAVFKVVSYYAKPV